MRLARAKAAFDRLSAFVHVPKLVAGSRKLAVEAPCARRERRCAIRPSRRGQGTLDVPLADLEMLARVPSDHREAVTGGPRSVNIDPHRERREHDPRLDRMRSVGSTSFAKRSVPEGQDGDGPRSSRAGLSLCRPVDARGRAWHFGSASTILGGSCVPGATLFRATFRNVSCASIVQSRFRGCAPQTLANPSDDRSTRSSWPVRAISGAMLDAHKFVHRQRVDPRGARDLASTGRPPAFGGLGARYARSPTRSTMRLRPRNGMRSRCTWSSTVGSGSGVIGTGARRHDPLPTLEQVRRTGRLSPACSARGALRYASGRALCLSAAAKRGRACGFSAQIAAYANITSRLVHRTGFRWTSAKTILTGRCFACEEPTVAPCFLPGFELIVFHPVIGRFVEACAARGRGDPTGYDDAQRWIGRHRPRRKSHPAPTKIAVGEDGLPLQQRWNLARRKLERARAAQHRAEHYLGIWGSPDALLLAANAHALEPLGYEAQRAPLRTYAIIHGFLENLIAGIERDACALERLGKNAAAGRPTRCPRSKTARALERRAEAFEFVDIALSEIVDESLEKGGASWDCRLAGRAVGGYAGLAMWLSALPALNHSMCRGDIVCAT